MGAERLAADFERASDGGVVLRLVGRLDRATVPLLDGVLSALRGETKPVVLDLSGVDHIDATGLTVLLAAEGRADGTATVEVTGVGESLRDHRHRFQ